ncbi:uncharacterized protein LOC128227668 [Mya arenaria]|uniref:uncharacterized protein LOC128227668 n=1 Tax=Mya arenaria TaxID=6604 RepID=UPI0022E8C24D|nr:uncharacterized protein LOC128227668 [Mya arenaria]XP_052794369.1 uncharacterized protein LOC128227668 [Mya arenaria]XP_052794370.1 uncharacterized protein LOC128227668 [Mya arenaria]
MGNTTSYVTEKDGKRDTLLLDSVVKEVSEYSSALRNTVEGIRHQQKQQTEDTTNAAKEMLDHMLRDVFGKLRDYFTTNASETCTESHEKVPDPTDSVDMIKKKYDLLTQADLSEDEIMELIGTMTKLKERHISVNNILAHFEEYGKRPSESNPSQPLSRGNSKKSFQPKQFSKEGKNHDRTERHANTIGAGNTAGTGDGTVNFEAGNCSVKERTGNRIVASVPGISEVRNKANPTIRDITEKRSVKGQTVNAYATSFTTNRTFAGKTSNPKLTGKARNNTFSCGKYEFGDGAETDKTSDGQREVVKGNENESLQTNDQTTNDDSTEIERLMKTERLLKDEILCLELTCTDHQNKLKLVTGENERLAKNVTTKEQDIKSKQKEIMSLKQDNEKLVLRLSKLAGEKLTKDNPNITDLSDPNRPTKLGEIYSELYDNEWTDAYEGLTIEGYEETEAI